MSEILKNRISPYLTWCAAFSLCVVLFVCVHPMSPSVVGLIRLGINATRQKITL